jgi:TPR repeat protein
LEKGEGIKKDMSEALSLLDDAARADHKKAKTKLDSLLKELKSKASECDAESEYLLGRHLVWGWGEESERKEGFQWLLKAAEKGHNGAQYDVALILLGEYTNELCVQSYYNESGRTKHLNWNKINRMSAEHVIPINIFKGKEWLQKSAESKNIEAMKYLFQAYIQGRNFIPRNYEKAYLLAQERLKLKDSAAAMSLGAMYFYGIGVKKPDPEKALEYWNLAANMGYEGAKFFLAQQSNPNLWENFDYMGKKTEFTGADGWENFESNYKGKIWDWCEIEEKYINDVSTRECLNFYMKDDFDKIVWVCKIKGECQN